MKMFGSIGRLEQFSSSARSLLLATHDTLGYLPSSSQLLGLLSETFLERLLTASRNEPEVYFLASTRGEFSVPMQIDSHSADPRR